MKQIKDLYYDIKWGISNYFRFRKVIWEWRPWDGKFQEDLFAFGLEQVKNEIESGNEDRRTALKKIKAIEEVVHELRRDIDEEFSTSQDIDEFEKVKVERFNKIARLIKGQEYRGQEFKSFEEYAEWFDGSGIDGWWE